ncbi:MAG: hypothetical protein JWP56_385, partial [Aeromicrobium sp.]|nr:hypothetical protein [Aeromicrobium sp.]
MPLLGRLLVAALLLASLTTCGGDEPAVTKLPDGVTVHLEQSRVQRQGRVVFLRVHIGTKAPITVER